VAKSDLDTLLSLLEEKGLGPCPACGVTKWGVGASLVGVPAELGEGFEQNAGFRAIALICENCGLLHLHNVGMLAGTLEEVADDTEGEDQEADESD
jgi:hypothetical protein